MAPGEKSWFHWKKTIMAGSDIYKRSMKPTTSDISDAIPKWQREPPRRS
jgi:hypothetical protein